MLFFKLTYRNFGINLKEVIFIQSEEILFYCGRCMWKGKFLRPQCLFCPLFDLSLPCIVIMKHSISVETKSKDSLKVKVTQSCLTLCDPHGLYSPWNSPGQNPGVGNLSLLQGIFPTQGSNPSLPHCRQILHQLSDQGSPGLFVTVQSEITTKAY